MNNQQIKRLLYNFQGAGMKVQEKREKGEGKKLVGSDKPP